MEMLQLLETIRAEEASVQRLFNNEGTRLSGVKHSRGYEDRVDELLEIISEATGGRGPSASRALRYLREAMTTSDFPYLFGDALDRQMLGAYREAPATWMNYIKRGRVRDFRTVKRFSVYGADQVLGAVVGQQGEYPYEEINENAPYTYNVAKYGRKIHFAWETMVNDDLDALKDQPERLGRAARRSEEKFATQLFVDASGPHASMYTVGNKNIVTGNPALSVAGLQTAMEILSQQTDENGEPIIIDTVELVYAPALEVTVQNVLNAITIEATEKGGTSARKLTIQNWMKTTFRPNKNAYIPVVASTANGNTSWFLFANPDNGRPAAEMGFLIGHEEPEVFMKTPNQTRVGGGSDAMDGDFESDAIEHKVRHVFGGTRMDPKMTVGSNGSGS